MISKRYYISGPMTGIPEYNYPMSELVTKELRAKGYIIVTPTEVGNALEAEYGVERYALSYPEYIKANVIALLDCASIILLPGWRDSTGAKLELHIAQTMKMTVWNIRLDGFRLWRHENEEYIEHELD